MSSWRAHTLTGWGRTSSATVQTARPERLSDLKALTQETGHLMAYGLGRSYGDACVPVEHSRAIVMQRLDRLVAFDETTGLLTAEAGVSFADILKVFLPKGWLIPVSPGSSFVTLGGAIANDVHGKNHISAGSLGNHLEWIDLLLPSGEEIRVSATQNAPIFHATIGGLGLTGIIIRAAVHLMPTRSNAMAVTRYRAEDLDHMFASFMQMPVEDTYAVAWIDALASGQTLGRGIFERAHSAPQSIDARHKAGPGLPFNLPGFTLNPLSVRLFNNMRYNMAASSTPTLHTVPVEKFFYPLDSIQNWNRMYGKRGFHQFQAVIPDASAQQGIRQLLEAISQSRRASFLAVLKRLGSTGQGMLSFPLPGYTLALDFPNSSGVHELLSRLINITRNHGGRIYLAKDSAITADDFMAMYPMHTQFREVLAQVDPHERMSHQMALRLGLRTREGGAA